MASSSSTTPSPAGQQPDRPVPHLDRHALLHLPADVLADTGLPAAVAAVEAMEYVGDVADVVMDVLYHGADV